MKQLIFGLDIGIASVGWSVLDGERIVDLGVRCFDKAETAKEGDPLNLIRRQSRLLRRRLYRRAWRLTKLARLLKREGVVEDARLFSKSPSFSEVEATGTPTVTSAWVLRRDGLDRLLTSTEWARVIYHLCKHRGFHWTSKAEEAKADSDAEGGRVKQGLKGTKALMEEKGYRSAAEMILTEFPTAQRNKRGQYDKALSRVLLGQEMALLFVTQRRLGNQHASERIEELILGNGDRRSGLFWQQKPALSGDDLLEMLGNCTFETSEKRAPKASFSAERHVWLTRLNNLRMVEDGRARPLNEAERTLALLLPYETKDFKYKTLKNELVRAGLWTTDIRFSGMSYPSPAQLEVGKAKDPEDQILVKLSAWHELRLAFKRERLEPLWQQICTPALEGQPDLLDKIAWVLSVYKDGAEITEQLRKLPLPEPDTSVAILEKISFDKFSSLSLAALRRIVPLMEKGLRYDEAVAQIPEYGHHSQIVKPDATKHLYLPPFYENEREYKSKSDRIGSMKFRVAANIPRNPVVLRSLNQTRKVVNALIRQYGSPTAVHIEVARDLSRPMDERNQVKKAQDEFRDRNAKAREDFEQGFGYKPKSAVFEKWMLYREQHGQCAYSQQALDIQRVLDDANYAQIDHALPYSRSYDDSKNNKVLVLTRENQNKGNRTPFEYLTSFPGGEDGERWRNFVAWVQQNKAYRMAKRNRLLRKNYGQEESRGFIDRNLNDTRYICKFFKNYVEEHLQLALQEDGDTNRRCVVVNGQLTAFLRAKWGLTKNREESDRHHALDATVVAACTHSMVKSLADHSRAKELAFLQEGFPDSDGVVRNTAAFDRGRQRFPEPWPHFRHELQSRLFNDDLAALREDMQRLGTYSAEVLNTLRTVFVSRAPQRRNGGAVHKDTIYARPHPDHRLMVEEKSKEGRTRRRATDEELKGMVVERFDVFATADKGKRFRLNASMLSEVVGADRNAWMVHALQLWLAERGDDPKKPGTKDYPRKPLRGNDFNGPFTGPEIKSVKVNAGRATGFAVRHGLAENERMIRVDVFSKADKFHLVPVYVHHRVTGLPSKAIMQGKDEDEWTQIDETFTFLFSLHPNDFVKVQQKGKAPIAGYFASAHRGTGNINLWLHDRATSTHKEGAIEGIGVKTALSFEKLNVDVLGHQFPALPEVRHGLA